MQQTVGLTMGVPPNPRVAEEYAEFATAEEEEMLRVVNHDRELDRMPRYEAPPGTGTWRDAMERALEEITLSNVGISDAASSMITDINRGIDRASA